MINDTPHLNNFDRALEEYRRTIEDYPGSAAAAKAAERKRLIESYWGGEANPHQPAP